MMTALRVAAMVRLVTLWGAAVFARVAAAEARVALRGAVPVQGVAPVSAPAWRLAPVFARLVMLAGVTAVGWMASLSAPVVAFAPGTVVP
nr:hypothetical protein GCM10010200_066400 [Actinomadura rugatobispora]